jgi:hypothetical protein
VAVIRIELFGRFFRQFRDSVISCYFETFQPLTLIVFHYRIDSKAKKIT